MPRLTTTTATLPGVMPRDRSSSSAGSTDGAVGSSAVVMGPSRQGCTERVTLPSGDTVPTAGVTSQTCPETGAAGGTAGVGRGEHEAGGAGTAVIVTVQPPRVRIDCASAAWRLRTSGNDVLGRRIAGRRLDHDLAAAGQLRARRGGLHQHLARGRTPGGVDVDPPDPEPGRAEPSPPPDRCRPGSASAS